MKADVVGGLVGALTGVAVVVGSLGLRIGTPSSPQPGFVPFLGGMALVALSCVLLVQAGLGRSTGTEAFGDVRRPAVLVGGLGVYVSLLDPLGYVVATVLIAGVILGVLGLTSWRVLAVGSVALSLGTYLLFGRVLGVDLPPGVLGFLG